MIQNHFLRKIKKWKNMKENIVPQPLPKLFFNMLFKNGKTKKAECRRVKVKTRMKKNLAPQPLPQLLFEWFKRKKRRRRKAEGKKRTMGWRRTFLHSRFLFCFLVLLFRWFKRRKKEKETKKEKNWMKKNLAPQPLPQLLIPTSCQRSSSPWIETIANAKWKTSSREDDKPCQIQKMWKARFWGW